ERRPNVAAEEFFRHYWAANRPLVLTEVTARWPALERWTPAWLKERFGDLDVQVMAARDADPRCDENFETHRRTMRFAEYVDLVAAGSGNDVYLVAHNGLVDRPGFESLLDDVIPDETIFDTARLRPGGASFWFGAAGTRTPLHHDTTNILFCQIHGRKRVRLVAPNETGLLDSARGYYADVDVDDPAVSDVLVHAFVLAPCEALFLP